MQNGLEYLMCRYGIGNDRNVGLFWCCKVLLSVHLRLLFDSASE